MSIISLGRTRVHLWASVAPNVTRHCMYAWTSLIASLIFEKTDAAGAGRGSYVVGLDP